MNLYNIYYDGSEFGIANVMHDGEELTINFHYDEPSEEDEGGWFFGYLETEYNPYTDEDESDFEGLTGMKEFQYILDEFLEYVAKKEAEENENN
jgi:hypothetical protein